MAKISVGVLGATGTVGQTIVQMLEKHPWFEVTELAASERSAGKKYGEEMTTRWNVSSQPPEYAKEMMIKECKTNLKCDIVLSALDSSVAKEVEEDFAKAGYAVSSNAKNHRMDSDVPLLIPEINSEHVDLIKEQQKKRGWKGFIVTDPNCTTIGFTIALKPIIDKFGIEKVMVTSMQALSGAGYPGVASLDALDNVIPYINDEEEKVETESQKILGKFSKNEIDFAKFAISAQCNRVAVRTGHTECISIKLSKKATKEELIATMENYRPNKALKLPSSPEHPIVYLHQNNRPQPKLDVNTGNGMAVSVGRLRPCNILDWKFVVLSNNLVRGAAGAAILNAELLKVKGYLD